MGETHYSSSDLCYLLRVGIQGPSFQKSKVDISRAIWQIPLDITLESCEPYLHYTALCMGCGSLSPPLKLRFRVACESQGPYCSKIWVWYYNSLLWLLLWHQHSPAVLTRQVALPSPCLGCYSASDCPIL